MSVAVLQIGDWKSRDGILSLAAGCAILLAGCGSAQVPEPPLASAAPSTATQPVAAQADEEMEVEGIMGMLNAGDCHRAMDRRMRHFFQCFVDRSTDVEVLSGQVELSFRIARNGTVRWVYPSESTIGDRETERCLLDVAATTRFPEPRGGEAEFRFPIDFEAASDIRPPHSWSETRVRGVVARNGATVLQECRQGTPGTYRVTAYVGPGGQVLTVGGAVENADLAASLDCVTSAVSGWSMPNPGSYPAKVSFSLY